MPIRTLKPRLKKMEPRLKSTRQIRDTRYSQDASTRSAYKRKQWLDTREAVLLRDLYRCQMCGIILRSGRTDEASALVDHIKPAKLRPDLFHDMTNLQACCRQCHVTTCAEIEAKHWPDAELIDAAKRAIRPAA